MCITLLGLGVVFAGGCNLGVSSAQFQVCADHFQAFYLLVYFLSVCSWLPCVPVLWVSGFSSSDLVLSCGEFGHCELRRQGAPAPPPSLPSGATIASSNNGLGQCNEDQFIKSSRLLGLFITDGHGCCPFEFYVLPTVTKKTTRV